MKPLRILSFIIEILFIMVEVILAIGCIAVLILPEYDIQQDSYIMGIIFTLFFVVSVVIDFICLLRIPEGVRLVVSSALAMKFFAALVAFSAGCLFIPPYAPYASIYFVFIIADFAVGMGVYLLCRRISQVTPEKTYMGTVPKGLKYDCAEWYFNGAAAEYLMIHPEISSDQIHHLKAIISAYASTPIVCYVTWLIRRGLMSKRFYREVLPDEISDIRSGIGDPRGFFASHMRGVLRRSDIAESALRFTDAYYYVLPEKNRASLFSVCFAFDYFDVFCKNEHYFINEFSWENYLQLEKLLDRRYARFINVPLFESVGTLHSDLFGADVTITAENGVSDKYVKLCADNFQYPSDTLAEKLRSSIKDDFSDFVPDEMIIYFPKGEEPAYCIVGESEDYDPEHGLGITVRNDVILDVGYSSDVSNPWEYNNDINYRGMTGDLSDNVRVMIVPKEFNGKDEPDNYVTLPRFAAEQKRICDKRIEAIAWQGVQFDYMCAVSKNSEGEIDALVMSAKKGNNVYFYDGVSIPTTKREDSDG